MILKDGRLLVLVGECANEEIPVFSIGGILRLAKTDKALTGIPSEDMENGFDTGLIPCKDKDWKRIQRWVSNENFVTVELTRSGRYRFGRVTKQSMIQNGYLNDEDIFWLEAWAESTHAEDEPVKDVTQKTQKKKKKKFFRNEFGEMERYV